jgi:nucleoside-diphosphate-sugar epimerase
VGVTNLKKAGHSMIKNSPNNIVITGSAGFVGRRLIPELARLYPKKNFICLTKPNSSEFEALGLRILRKNGIRVLKCDLKDKDALKVLPKKPILIINLAAETDTFKTDHRVNNIGVKNLYKTIGPLNKKCHFIHIGTMVSVVGRKETSKTVDEKSNDFPTNEYTRTKVLGEKYLINKCKKDKFSLTILRPNTIYGRSVRPGSLFDIVKNGVLKQNTLVRINWPGKSALIHVDDVVNAIIQFTKIVPPPGKPEKYLLNAENLTIQEISLLMHSKLGIKYRPINLPEPVWGIARELRPTIPHLEHLLPDSLYNQLWRLSIIIDDVVVTDSIKVKATLKRWGPKKLEKCIADVVR